MFSHNADLIVCALGMDLDGWPGCGKIKKLNYAKKIWNLKNKKI